jgi:hypothetical protein
MLAMIDVRAMDFDATDSAAAISGLVSPAHLLGAIIPAVTVRIQEVLVRVPFLPTPGVERRPKR